MNLFETNTKSTNENAIVNLPAGVNDLTITSARLHVVKSTEEKMVAMDFSDGESFYSHFFAIAAQNSDRRRIAQGDMKATWDACKLSGPQGIDRLPNFVGKKVRYQVEHQNGEGGKVFANIRGAWHPDDPAAPALTGSKRTVSSTPTPPVHSADDALPGVTDPTDNPLSETPAVAPAAATPGKKWAKKTTAA